MPFSFLSWLVAGRSSPGVTTTRTSTRRAVFSRMRRVSECNFSRSLPAVTRHAEGVIPLTLHARGRPPLTARVIGVTAQGEVPILEVGGYPGVFFLTRAPTGAWQVARDGSPPIAGYEAQAADVEQARVAFLATLVPQPQV